MKNELTVQVLAMYLGQKCTSKWIETGEENEWPISTITINQFSFGLVGITPHLRRLDSLTEEEAQELYRIRYNEAWGVDFERLGMEVESCLERFWKEDIELYNPEGKLLIGHPPVWLKLLEWGIDVLGGIEAGWAKEIQNTTTP